MVSITADAVVQIDSHAPRRSSTHYLILIIEKFGMGRAYRSGLGSCVSPAGVPLEILLKRLRTQDVRVLLAELHPPHE